MNNRGRTAVFNELSYAKEAIQPARQEAEATVRRRLTAVGKGACHGGSRLQKCEWAKTVEKQLYSHFTPL